MKTLFIIFLSSYLICVNESYNIKSGVHQCVHITRKMSKNGDGSKDQPNSCMSCDPAKEMCPINCQNMIDQMYRVCDDVCLPYTYYYDANYNIDGCWHDVRHRVKIAVERCGCNGAGHVEVNWFTITTILIVVSVFISII